MKTYNHLKQFVGGYVGVKFPRIFRLLDKHKTGVKYVLSGGTAAMANLLFLYILTDIFGIWYLTSSVVAFIFGLLASFFLQKYWTFRENGLDHIKKQLTIYAILGGVNFFLTPALLYIFVEKFHVWYILGSVLVMASLAMVNYLINKFITFKKDVPHGSINA